MQAGERFVNVRNPDDIAHRITEGRRLSRTLNLALAEDNLREDLWRIMHALSKAQGMLMGELAELLVLPPATTTRLVDEMVDSGMVFRRPAPEDGRKVGVYLSRSGAERLQRVEALLEARCLDANSVERSNFVR